MRTSDKLSEFVRDALKEGQDKDRIRAALTRSGWSETEIAPALNAWNMADFATPVPRPTAYISAAEAFFFALMYFALGSTAWHLVMLLFALAEGVSDLQAGETFQVWTVSIGTIRWSFAALLVFFPIFLAMNLRTSRNAAVDPAKRRRPIQKWLSYIALILSVAALIGNAVWVVFGLIDGSVTALFLYRSAIVTAVAGAVVLFFMSENRDTPPPARSRLAGMPSPAQIVFSLLVAAALVGGWLASGGLAGARAEERDDDRVTDLARLETYVTCVADESGAPLPQTLSGNEGCWTAARADADQPGQTVEEWIAAMGYRYTRLAPFAYELCAEIERPLAANFYFAHYDAPWACTERFHRPPGSDAARLPQIVR